MEEPVTPRFTHVKSILQVWLPGTQGSQGMLLIGIKIDPDPILQMGSDEVEERYTNINFEFHNILIEYLQCLNWQ